MRIKRTHRKITMTHIQITCSNRIALRLGKTGPCPIEVGILAPVFEKSATKLLQKQKLPQCKSTIQIVRFNVRTLNRIGQLLELTASAIDHNIDIIWIQEHRYIHCEDIKYHDTDNGWTFVSTSTEKNFVNTAIGGVGMLMKIQPRMMVATFNDNPTQQSSPVTVLVTKQPSSPSLISYPPLFVASQNTTF